MFKKSRIKIIIYVMAMLLIVLAGTVAVIYFTTYHEINVENRLMLEIYAEQYILYGVPGSDEDTGDLSREDAPEGELEDEAPSDEDVPEGEEEGEAPLENVPADDAGISDDDIMDESGLQREDRDDSSSQKKFMVSTFYSVSFSDTGLAIEINNEDVSGMSDDELTSLALNLLESGKEFGTEDDIIFLITETDGFTLVTMMDNTVLGESIDSLIRYTVFFGGIAIIVLFILSIIISKWIIRPLEISYQKQKQFISDAGHELKTPVSAIEANSEILLRETGENKWLSNIQYENARMGALVKQLLDLARLENTSAVHTKVDFSHICLKAILPFEGVAYEAGLLFEYTIAENIEINGNEAQLEELVCILTDNAVEYTIPGGKIKITLLAVHGSAVLSVANEGKEIPEEERTLIFERFYRSDTSRSDTAGEDASDTSGPAGEPACAAGSEEAESKTPENAFSGRTTHYGLGLSIAKATVTSHGGKISVDCKDGFTEFKVTLPVK